MSKQRNENYKQIWLEKELIEKANIYCKNVGSNPTKLIRSLLTEFLERRVLTNDFIVLEKPLYFNAKELIEDGSVICSLDKPTNDLDNVYIIKNVPNNLDSFNDGTFYYEPYFKHKGIDFSAITLANDEKVFQELIINYLVFDLDLSDFVEKPELKISILKVDDLTTYLDIEKDKEIINTLKNHYNSYSDFLKNNKEFISANKLDLNKGLNDLPEELINKLAEAGYNYSQWKLFNSGLFIPVKLFSKLQQLIILFNNASSEDVSRLENAFKVSKAEIENYVSSFDMSNANFNLFLLNLSVNLFDNEVDSIVNSFINDSVNFSAVFNSELALD